MLGSEAFSEISNLALAVWHEEFVEGFELRNGDSVNSSGVGGDLVLGVNSSLLKGHSNGSSIRRSSFSLEPGAFRLDGIGPCLGIGGNLNMSGWDSGRWSGVLQWEW